MEKALIRETVRQARLSLNPQKVAELSQRILKQLIAQIDWQTVKNLHVYQTLPRLREVDTVPLIDHLKLHYSQLQIHHPEAQPVHLDLVIVPLLAFDKRGYRVGMGGGYYDRFLKKYPTATKIGLAFELQKVNHIPEETHDVPLDSVITERTVYNFSHHV